MVDKEKTSFVFYPGTVRIPERRVTTYTEPFIPITAEVEISCWMVYGSNGGKAEGPICALGGLGVGWSLYIKRSSLDILLQLHGQALLYTIYKRSTCWKKVKLRFEFEKTGQEKYGAGGIGRLYIND